MVFYILSFLWGLLFIYLYYRLVWCYSKIRGREFKLVTKYGKKSGQVKRFKKRFKAWKCGFFVRLLLFLIISLPVGFIAGAKGLGAFLLGVLAGNLTLFYLSVKRKL
jgi:hypothetical protein